MKHKIIVQSYVTVEVDETKFTPEFLNMFAKFMYPFATIDEHVVHLAKLAASGIIYSSDQFLEGYGVLSEMGIKVTVEGVDYARDLG